MSAESYKGQFYTVDDVSLLLGSPPVDCQPIDAPIRFFIGIYFDQHVVDHEEPRITSVLPKSPAKAAGFRVGDRILTVGGQSVESVREVVMALKSQATADAPIRIVTDRATLDVTPATAEHQQCYWEIRAGPVASSGAFASWNRYGGSGHSRFTAYDRYYKATCRFANGYLFMFNSNWQM